MADTNEAKRTRIEEGEGGGGGSKEEPQGGGGSKEEPQGGGGSKEEPQGGGGSKETTEASVDGPSKVRRYFALLLGCWLVIGLES